MEKKYDVAIIDGNNLFFKAFSVHKDFSVKISGKKVFTGGTYGLIDMLINVKKNYLKEDSIIIVCWDKGHKRRSLIYPEYKANRNKDEWEDYENFKTQMAQAKYVLSFLGIRQASKDGEEADDVCGTLSKLQKEAGKEVILVSADKDYQQLLDDSVDLLANKGQGNIKLWDVESWERSKGYNPKYFSYFLALRGDDGDNIPGVKGIGEKTADKFLKENFELIEAMIDPSKKFFQSGATYEELIPEKQSAAMKKLLENVEDLKLSYELALIDKNIEGIKVKKIKKDMDKIEEIFETLKFNSFLDHKYWSILEVL
ncbi:MAG: polymerase [Sedimentibacter sp.]|nr:polymerase [Sedimentibacter sp.]